MKPHQIIITLLSLSILITSCGKSKQSGKTIKILNVSYDPTREFYVEINAAFQKKWDAEHGKHLEIEQSHGGSGKQSRSVIDGLEADVVTLALAGDIDAIHQQTNRLPENWQTRLPYNSSPYTSTIVFVVRKGNPKAIKDWSDLTTKGLQVITPNPKTSGGARWNYLAAWTWAARNYAGDQTRILDYMNRLFKNVPVLDTGARGSTTTFAQRGIGDVLLSWENEAYLIEKEFPGQTQIVYPSISILAEPPVALVDKNAEKHGTREVAEAYLKFLYTDEAQDLAGKHFYRPRNEEIGKRYLTTLPSIPLVTIDEEFGGWKKAQKIHFDDGGTFDRIYQP
ncbi:sulfate ABC transporter substrate-binding protein [Luteolibacter pohnpeiensis]|uniref:Sulfate ABC transporter substrate-binding protein n=1 Tax=Luteolibacter pohnpeiensis TaxID=454153 RepID=A0A934S5E5_9BACT|nr:sulfate ABC transporter substrate-binding protein [Luteolibacter pohnpeiensis]MBK1881489.1 sulfate ABC transporter substrate-binding protein [Luteolibacter pohnpeiensis]